MPYLPLPTALHRPALYIGVGLLCLLVLLSAASGALSIPLLALPSLLLGQPEAGQAALWQAILLDVRLPRIVMAVTVGSALAVAGCGLQAVFRNPLAEPGLVGASSGAALAAALAISFGSSAAVAPAAFGGALGATWLAWLLGQDRSGRDSTRLLLAGVAINALCGAMLTLLNHLADDQALRGSVLWAMGSLASASWQQLVWLLPALLVCTSLIWRERQALDALLLGEREAFHLGYALKPLRRRLIALAALTIALTVAACGALGFVGLLAPHLARLLLGPAHRSSLLGAALLGAMVVLLADWLARMLILPAELPLGAVLSAVGAPFFLYLLHQGQRRR